MTDSTMKFIVTSKSDVATKLQHEGYKLLHSCNGKYTFIYNEALPHKFSQSSDCYLTSTLTF